LLTLRRVVRKEGIQGLWRGNGLNLIRTAPYRSINYYAYDHTKKAILRATGQTELNNSQRLLAGATAGVIAILCCFPLDVLRTRMLSKGGEHLYANGPIRTLGRIVSTEGFGALYVGVVPALASLAPSNAVFYSVYDFLKTSHVRKVSQSGEGKVLAGSEPLTTVGQAPSAAAQLELGAKWTLLYGGLAGVAAETSVYPLEVIRRRLQLVKHVARNGRLDRYMADLLSAVSKQQTVNPGSISVNSFNNVKQVMRFILRREGVRGLYWGILPTVLQVMPSAAISFYIFEVCKVHLNVHDNGSCSKHIQEAGEVQLVSAGRVAASS